MLSKWSTSWCAIKGTCSIWSPWWLWQRWSKSRIERNRQRKREVLWNPIVNGRGTLGLLKYDRPRQRRTFCNAMWLLLSVSNHWQVHWECFFIQFPYITYVYWIIILPITWLIQHTPMSPRRGTIKTKTGHMILSKNNPYVQIWSDRLIYGYRPIDFFFLQMIYKLQRKTCRHQK